MDEFPLTAVFFSLGYFLQSLFGFGAAFIIVLGLSVFIPIKSVVGMIPVSLIAASGMAILREHNKVRWRKIFVLYFLSLPGVALGAILLNRVSSQIIVILVCLLVLAYGTYSLTVKRFTVPRFLRIPYLLISGFIIGTTGLGIAYIPMAMQEIEDSGELRVSLNLL